MDNIFVVGTDTGVGKTVLSLLLMQFFLKRGSRPFYLKPLQTGCNNAYDVDSDAAFVYRHVESLREHDPAESLIYCFRNPKAPFFAARDEGREIDLGLAQRIVEEKSRRHSPLILEAAGGLLVPIREKTLMVDTIVNTGAKALLAARAGLGTINHTLLSVEALSARGIGLLGIVFLDSSGTPEYMISENREAVERHSGIQVSGVIRKIHNFDHPPEECFHPLEFIFPEGAP
jgi:dethiobiotin synthetase